MGISHSYELGIE
ncbi:hypothetical protein MTR67_000690 [Solanum verrucosum]|nr:hypothetical protein MTR67_000284 [Solanum verrucosum]WMV07305.1 hypothetical protein MTR67_000690 [Solanum verrucosum]